MSAAPLETRGSFARYSHAFRVLNAAGLMSPRFLFSVMRGVREAGATSGGIAGGHYYRGWALLSRRRAVDHR